MKINKISLYNFNSFEGLNEFDFTIEDDKKNIILIGGKNGAGKTSLFTAIKVALYGPLAYGYIGSNPHYIAKIKECINSKAFQMKKVEARVQIEISLMVEREVKDYQITREWDYSNQKLVEHYCVKNGEQQLDAQDLSYFQNYLQSLIPPDLFEFFLFDGEEVGSIFSTSSYNAYVKNAVYTLCGLDIYEMIRKYTRGYAGKATTKDEAKIIGEYEELKSSVERMNQAGKKLRGSIQSAQAELEQIEIDLTELNTAFKNAGGMTKAERQSLSEEFQRAERIKTESLTKMKLFMEGLMPFYITKEFTDQISNQLDFEEKGEIYYYIQQKLDKTDIQNALSESVSENTINILMDTILTKFKPTGFDVESTPMFDLSKEDTGRVNAMISSLKSFDVQDMINTVQNKQKASDQTTEINKILKNTMSDEDLLLFTEREHSFLKRKDELRHKLSEDQLALERLESELSALEQQCEKLWQRVKENVRNKHVYELSSGLSAIMDTLLKEKTVEIREKLENLIVNNLQRIYRKNNLITHIEIDDTFQFNLYQNATYTAGELSYLMQNHGKSGFAVLVGKQGLKTLYEYYDVVSLKQLQRVLLFHSADQFNLYKNIDLSRLSKGERQIFILSLYWAIIELSGQDIPFVIDTPYARIDANHRKEISEKFFPSIGKQVVILSTDEEINEEYYRIMKPYVAKEYLLINDENQNKTSVEQHYFFEV